MDNHHNNAQRCAECHYAECRYAECCGALKATLPWLAFAATRILTDKHSSLFCVTVCDAEKGFITLKPDFWKTNFKFQFHSKYFN